jgi:hypothetical protein
MLSYVLYVFAFAMFIGTCQKIYIDYDNDSAYGIYSRDYLYAFSEAYPSMELNRHEEKPDIFCHGLYQHNYDFDILQNIS